MKQLAILACLMLGACTHAEKSDLPTGATEITDKGNGWYTFKFDGEEIPLSAL